MDAIATLVSRARLDANSDEVVDRLDTPRPRPAETLLRRLGVREDVARLLAPAATIPLAGAAVTLLQEPALDALPTTLARRRALLLGAAVVPPAALWIGLLALAAFSRDRR